MTNNCMSIIINEARLIACGFHGMSARVILVEMTNQSLPMQLRHHKPNIIGDPLLEMYSVKVFVFHKYCTGKLHCFA